MIKTIRRLFCATRIPRMLQSLERVSDLRVVARHFEIRFIRGTKIRLNS